MSGPCSLVKQTAMKSRLGVKGAGLTNPLGWGEFELTVEVIALKYASSQRE
jgi:hypothetical protein